MDERAWNKADHERHMAGAQAVGCLESLLASGDCTSETATKIVADWKRANAACGAALDAPDRSAA